MCVGEGHLQRVKRQINVGSILIPARRGDSLHHLDRVLGHLARSSVLAAPVRVSELGDDVSALLQRVQRQRYVELAA